MKSTKLFKVTLFCLMLTALFLSAGCSDDDDNPTAPTPTVHSDLVTVWRATEVTIDDIPVEMAEFFELSVGAVVLQLTINADTSCLIEELDSATDPANTVYYEEGTAVSSGTTLTLTIISENGTTLATPRVAATGTWSVDGVTMTFTMDEDEHTIVITWNNWLT